METRQPIQDDHLVKVMPYNLLTKGNKDEEMLSI